MAKLSLSSSEHLSLHDGYNRTLFGTEFRFASAGQARNQVSTCIGDGASDRVLVRQVLSLPSIHASLFWEGRSPVPT